MTSVSKAREAAVPPQTRLLSAATDGGGGCGGGGNVGELKNTPAEGPAETSPAGRELAGEAPGADKDKDKDKKASKEENTNPAKLIGGSRKKKDGEGEGKDFWKKIDGKKKLAKKDPKGRRTAKASKGVVSMRRSVDED